MIKQTTYNYLSKLLFLGSFIFLLIFIFLNFNYSYKLNVNYTEASLTLFFSLLLLSFLTLNSLGNDEFNHLLFYFTYIGAIPVIYHLSYFLFFKKYKYKNMSYTKIGIIFIIMFYLSIVWFNVKNLINKNTIYINNKLVIKNLLQILFSIPI